MHNYTIIFLPHLGKPISDMFPFFSRKPLEILHNNTQSYGNTTIPLEVFSEYKTYSSQIYYIYLIRSSKLSTLKHTLSAMVVPLTFLSKECTKISLVIPNSKCLLKIYFIYEMVY